MCRIIRNFDSKIKLLLLVFTMFTPPLSVLEADIPQDWERIFVSAENGDDSNPGTVSDPFQTLARAKEKARNSSAEGFAIFLKGGENYTPETPMRSQVLIDYCWYRYRAAFIWNIDKPLLLSTYGNEELAHLGPGTATSTTSQTEVDPNALQHPIIICYPCSANVTIENLHIKHWELGGIFPFKYLPSDPQTRLTIRNNVFEEIGTMFFPEETFLQPGENYTIYAADVIQPRTSQNVDIIGNIFKNCTNYFDYEHSTPFLMDSFHVFYVAKSYDVQIMNNIIVNSGGTPLKAKYARTYDFDVYNNAFFYTSPSEQLNTVQEGFVRCHEDASMEVDENYFYCPYVWPDHENPDTAVAVMSSGTSQENIDWGENGFEMPYYEPPEEPYFTNMGNISAYPGNFVRRYYDCNDFIYLTPRNWSPNSTDIEPYRTFEIPDSVGLMDYKYDAYFYDNGEFVDTHTGWDVQYIMSINNEGVITAYGTSNDAQYAGWVILAPKEQNPFYPPTNVVFEDNFNQQPIKDHWQVSYYNTNEANISYTFDESKLSFNEMNPLNDEKWTSVFLTTTFESPNDLHIDFRQNWQQSSPADMPYLQLFIKSQGILIATVGYEDKSTTAYGYPRVYTETNGEVITGQPSVNKTGDWDIRRIEGLLEIYLDGELFSSVQENRLIDEIVIAVQGRNMLNSVVGWNWDSELSMGVDVIRVCQTHQSQTLGDFEPNGNIDISDLAQFSSRWLDTNCSADNWCDWKDLDFSNSVDFQDFAIFAENWLN